MLGKILFLAAATVAVTAVSPSSAQPRHRHKYYVQYDLPTTPATYGRSLTIRKRSYLDPGNVVQPGTEETYIAESTYLNAPYVTKDLFHDRFESNLPNRFEVPGRPEPVFEFETPRVP